MNEISRASFPKGFTWGAITASYQIEGAYNEDGKGVSIWDTFVDTPGKIERGENARVAVDHYHRYPEDIDLMVELGMKAYCFSTAWTRILPNGTGKVNPKGLDFYDRLVDALLAKKIEPWLMLYHWDLPQELQDKGGWANRDTASRMVEYSEVVATHLGDRVKHWVTHNEPFVSTFAGHFTGQLAPGLQDPFITFQSVHNLLLSHGLSTRVLRQSLPADCKVGIILNLTPTYPATNSEEDELAAWRRDGVNNRLFLDPIFRGTYPKDLLELVGPMFPEIQPGDMALISQPLDFLGVNYYSREVVRHDPEFPFIEASPVLPPDSEYSQMWEIYPDGIYDVLIRVKKDYPVKDIYITENGVCIPDGLDFDGRIRDIRRIRYLHDHLFQVQRAIHAGVPLRGYFHWTLMDNFEWAFGYRMRFGLVYVDFETQKRTIKDSGYWYRKLIKTSTLEALSERFQWRF